MTDIRVKNELRDAIIQSSDVNSIDLPNNLATDVSLNLQPEDVTSYTRRGDDLVMQLANGETIVIEDFFVVQPDGQKNRLFFGEDDPLVEAISTDGGFQFAEVTTTSENAGLIFEEGAGAILAGSGAGIGSAGLVAAGLGIAGLAALGGGGGDDAPALDAPVIDPTQGDVITGQALPGATVTLTIDGETFEVPADPVTGAFTFTPDTPLADGTPITATQELDGETSGPGTGAADSSAEVTLDADAGDAGQTVSGTGDPNSDVVLTVEGVTIGTGTTDEDGNFEIAVSPAVELGDDIEATLTDPAGNTAMDDAVANPVLDPPVIDATDGDVLTGTAAPGATVTGTIGEGPEAEEFTATADDNGNWVADPVGDFPAGTPIVAEQALNGLTSEEAMGETDLSAPEVEIAEAAVLDGTDTVISGTGTPNSDVEVFDEDGDSLGTVETDADGNWSLTTDAGIDDGDTITAVLTDAGGDTTRDTEIVALELAPPVIDPTQGDVLTGTGVPGATVEGTIGEGAAAEDFTAVVDDDGNWVADPVGDFADETPIVATQTLDGLDSAEANGETDLDLPSIAIDDVAIVDGTDTTISGTGEPNSDVEVFGADGTSLGTTTTDADGDWTLDTDATIADGDEITAELTDANDVTVTDIQDVSLEIAPPVIFPTTGDVLTGTGIPGAEVTVTIGEGDDAEELTATVDDDGNWIVDPVGEIGEGEVFPTDTPIVASQTLDGLSSDDAEGATDLDAPTVQIDNLVVGAETVISGTGLPNSSVEVFNEAGTSLGTVDTDAAGDWELTPPEGSELEEGEEILAVLTDENDQTAADSEVVMLDFDGDGVANEDDVDADGDGILDYNEVEGELTELVNLANGVEVGDQSIEFGDGALVNSVSYSINGDPVEARTDGRGFEYDEVSTSAGTHVLELDVPVRELQLDLLPLELGSEISNFVITYSDGSTQNVGISGESVPGFGQFDDAVISGTPEAGDQVIEGIGNAAQTQAATRITFLDLNSDLRIQSVSYDFAVTGGREDGTRSNTNVFPVFPEVDENADLDDDGAVNYLDADSDGDGIDDTTEAQGNPATPVAPSGNDADGDGLDDNFEAFATPGGTEEGLSSPDTDADGALDFLDADVVMVAATQANMFLNLSDVEAGTETVDLGEAGAGVLTLSAADLLDTTPDENILTVFGNSDDSVIASGLTATGNTVSEGGTTFDEFTGSGATLLVEQDVDTQIV